MTDRFEVIALPAIRRDGGTQARTGNDEATVELYTDAMRDGRWQWHDGNRITVFDDGEHVWLADGFHRLEAASRAGLRDIPSIVKAGTRRDAVLYAAGANAEHGLRRSRADVRRAIEALLRDDEWRTWSNAEIARRVHTTDKTVAVVRGELEVAGEIPAQIERQGADGKTYTRKTGSEIPNLDTTRTLEDPEVDRSSSLEAVATELRRGDTKAAYAAARSVPRDVYTRAMAAVDALTEGRPLEEALALLSGQQVTAEEPEADSPEVTAAVRRAAAIGWYLGVGRTNDAAARRVYVLAPIAPHPPEQVQRFERWPDALVALNALDVAPSAEPWPTPEIATQIAALRQRGQAARAYRSIVPLDQGGERFFRLASYGTGELTQVATLAEVERLVAAAERPAPPDGLPAPHSAEADTEAPAHTPPPHVEPAISPSAWTELSRRASAFGARMLGYSTETVLIEPDGTKSRYPIGAEQQLADRVAHFERLADGLPAATPAAVEVDDGDDPDEEPDRYSVAVEQTVAAMGRILARLSEAELRLLATVAEGSQMWHAPLDTVRAGLLYMAEDAASAMFDADGEPDDEDAVLHLIQLGITGAPAAEPDAPEPDDAPAFDDAGDGPRGLAALIADIERMEQNPRALPATLRGEADLLERDLQDYAAVMEDAQYETLAARIGALRRRGQEPRKGAA